MMIQLYLQSDMISYLRFHHSNAMETIVYLLQYRVVCVYMGLSIVNAWAVGTPIIDRSHMLVSRFTI